MKDRLIIIAVIITVMIGLAFIGNGYSKLQLAIGSLLLSFICVAGMFAFYSEDERH